MLRKLAISLATTTALLTAAHAGSGFGIIRKDVSVSYYPTDLSTEAGARVLLARINEAAQQACGGSPYFYGTYSISPSLARRDFATCQANAVSSAIKSLNAPLLMRLYARNGDASLRIADR